MPFSHEMFGAKFPQSVVFLKHSFSHKERGLWHQFFTSRKREIEKLVI